MSELTEKANQLRSQPPRAFSGTAPQDTGIRLSTFQKPEGELRFTWNVYEDRPYLRFQLWSKSDDGSYWPVKGQGLTIKVKDLPDLAEGVQKALDMALGESGKLTETRATGRSKPTSRAYEGAGAPF